jgi:RNA recognition motif-containing protein
MRLYVGNLAPETTEKQLQRLFETVGRVASVRVVKDHENGAPKGFALVDMANSKQAERAIHKLDGSELHDHSLQVRQSHSGKDRRHQDRRVGLPSNWLGPDRREADRRQEEPPRPEEI